MKLIKIFPDRVQIKTDTAQLKGIKINDLLTVSDGTVTIVCIVAGVVSNDSLDVYDYDNELFGQTEANNTIECGILGSLRNGRFTKSIDVYPTAKVEISAINAEQFRDMLSGGRGSRGLDLGHYSNYEVPALIDGNKLFQRHFAVLGNTGSGKSVAISSLLEKAAELTASNIILFDLHGEYRGLDFAKTIKIGNDGMRFPMWFLPFRDIYSSILRLKDESATLQLAALRKAFYAAREDDRDENIPVAFFLDDVLLPLVEENNDFIDTGEVYKTGARAGEQKLVKGENNGKLTSLIMLLKDKMLDARYKFMCEDAPQDYLCEFLNGVFGISEKNVKIIDLSDAPHDMVPTIIAVTTKLIYALQLQQERGKALPLCIVCEEAHAYIPATAVGLGASQRRLLEVFEIIAKEGRKFGTTLCVVSQRPSELNKTIMAQCANFIVMKMTNETDKSMIKGILPDASKGIIDALSLFSPGDCLVIGDSAEIPLKTRISMPSQMPNSQTVNTWDTWAEGHRLLDVDALVGRLLENED